MIAKASISTGWRVRLGGMAAMFAGFCIYFIYDGFVGYPKQREIYQQFQSFQAEHPQVTDAKLRELWEEEQVPKGLPPIGARDAEPFHSYNHSDSSILWQKILGFGLIPVAGMLVFSWFKTFSRWVAVDEQGVTASTGQRAPWDSILKLDKTRWPKKGIAFIHYNDPDRQIEQRILLDDFKFDRAATEQIVRAIEDHVRDEQIIGDIRETERDRRKAEKIAAAAVKPAATPATQTPAP